jgi:hypothetical protein
LIKFWTGEYFMFTVICMKTIGLKITKITKFAGNSSPHDPRTQP